MRAASWTCLVGGLLMVFGGVLGLMYASNAPWEAYSLVVGVFIMLIAVLSY